MSFLAPDEFSGLVIGDDSVSGVLIKRKGASFLLLKQLRVEGSGSAAVKRADDELGIGAETLCVVAAAIPGAALFRTELVGGSLRQKLDSLEFELPRQLAKVPDASRTGFTEPVKGAAVVWTAPESGFQALFSSLAQAPLKPDAAMHPAQALPDPSDRLHTPELDGDFVWCGDRFEHLSSQPDANGEITAKLSRKLRPPTPNADALKPEFAAPALLALFAADPDFRAKAKGLKPLLPDTLRANRYKVWIKTAAILTALLALNYAFVGGRHLVRTHLEYKEAESELLSLRARNDLLQKSLSAREKQARERAKALENTVCVEHPAETLARIASLLPEEVSVASVRWNSGKVAVTLTGSGESNVAKQLAADNFFKVEVNSQTTRNNVVMYDLTLTPAGDE